LFELFSIYLSLNLVYELIFYHPKQEFSSIILLIHIFDYGKNIQKIERCDIKISNFLN